jgi:hypothetical protein
MSRYLPIFAVITLLLYPASGMAKHETAPEIDNELAAIWDACDRLFGPAPDPGAAKNWTADEQRRANNVVDCVTQVQRKLRELSIRRTGI